MCSHFVLDELQFGVGNFGTPLDGRPADYAAVLHSASTLRSSQFDRQPQDVAFLVRAWDAMLLQGLGAIPAFDALVSLSCFGQSTLHPLGLANPTP